MYELHFGLSGPPFQLNPDPAFYFGSRGHAHALAYLKFGVYQGEGFIVVTGEIGAGKTTLVRTLLDSLDPEQVVAAQIVSTQLESGDLLRSILAAFGIPPAGQTKAQLIASLEGFLTALAARGRRALLVVDEAQNLRLDVIEELRMLSNFQIGSQALLQSFLVGQPELRNLLESKAMEQLRQRVIASCHLGPLDAPETKAYVEHRLHHVGWQDRPHFEPGSFENIHRWCEGVPRRINLLCNRLLLAAYLAGSDTIAAADVERTARELRREVGESLLLRADLDGAEWHTQKVTSEPSAAQNSRNLDVVRMVAQDDPRLRQPLVCVADNAVEYAQALVLAHALSAYPDLPAMVVVNPGTQQAVGGLDASIDVMLSGVSQIHLGVADDGFAARAAAMGPRFDAVLREFSPRAVFVLGQSDAVLTCALAARDRGVGVMRLEAGQRAGIADQRDTNGALIDRLADVLYTSAPTAHHVLHREGLPADRVVNVGSAMAGLVRALLPHSGDPRDILEKHAIQHGTAAGSDLPAYALVAAQIDSNHVAGTQELVDAVNMLARKLPVLWLMSEATIRQLEARRLSSRLQESGVALVPMTSYLVTLGLLRHAACLIGSPRRELFAEAEALGVRAIAFGADLGAPTLMPVAGALARSADQTLSLINAAVAAARDADSRQAVALEGCAARIAAHLRIWLPKRNGRLEHGLAAISSTGS
jgi:general secretion pathway protein A